MMERFKQNNFIRKVNAWMLCLCMVITLLPATALSAQAAAGDGNGIELSVYKPEVYGTKTESYTDENGDTQEYEVKLVRDAPVDGATGLFVPDDGEELTVSENGVARLRLDDTSVIYRSLQYNVRIAVTDKEMTQCAGTVTVPIPDGYSTENSKITWLNSGEADIEPSAHTDSTASYPITLQGENGWLTADFSISLRHAVTPERLGPVTLPVCVYDAYSHDYIPDSSGNKAVFQPESALFVNDQYISEYSSAYVRLTNNNAYDVPSGFQNRRKYSLQIPLDYYDEEGNTQPRKGTLTLPLASGYDGNKCVLTFEGEDEGIPAKTATADTVTFEVSLPYDNDSALAVNFSVDSKMAMTYTNSVRVPLEFYQGYYGSESQSTQVNVGTSLTLNTEEKFDFYVDETTRSASATVLEGYMNSSEQEQGQSDPGYEDPFKDYVFIENGYDILLSYDIIALVNSAEHTHNPDIAQNGTLTIQIPAGYEGKSAKVTILQNYVEMETNPLQAATAYTDKTVTFPISFKYDEQWSNDDGCVRFWCYIEFKKAHTHIYPNTWKYDTANHWKECTVCGEKAQSAAHTWNAGVVTKEATASAEGVKTYTCTVCGATRTEAIAKLDVPDVGTKETDSTGAADYKVTSTEDGDVEVQYVSTNKKSAKTVTIPETVTLADGTEAKVTSIANGAFKNAKNVTTVTVGKNVETIGSSAFQGAKKLKKVTIGKNVTTIGNNAFKNCTSLTTVTVKGDSVKTIGSGAFQGAKKLKSVSVGKNVTTVGKNAFNGCKNLKTITIKSTKIKSFGKGAFKGISDKATIKVPKSKFAKYKKELKKAGLSSKVKIKKA